MKRYDLRHLHDNFYDRMMELIDEGLAVGEVGIFLFEIGDFSPIQKSADLIKASGHDLMNSIKFNEVDWTIVVKKLDEETASKRAEEYAKAKREAEEAAAKAAAEAEAKAKAAEEAKAAKAQAQSTPEPAVTKVKAAGTAPKADAKAAAKPEATKETVASATKEEKTKEVSKEPKKPTKKTADDTAKADKNDAKAKADVKKTDTKPAVSQGDDLTVIKGIGKVYQEKLNSEGIYTIEDVANMNDEQIQMMEEKYSFKGDFKESVADAKRLLKKKAK